MKNKTKIFSLMTCALGASLCLAGSLYFNRINVEAKTEVNTTDKFTFADGASIRIDTVNSEADTTTGIRFTAEVDNDLIEGLKTQSVSEIGMIIVPTNIIDAFETSNYTDYFEYLQKVYNKEKTEISTSFDLATLERTNQAKGVIIKIQDENYNLAYSAVSYYIDADGKYYYSADESESRTISYVADAALRDTDENYGDEAREALGNIIEKAICIKNNETFGAFNVEAEKNGTYDLKTLTTEIKAEDIAYTLKSGEANCENGVITFTSRGRVVYTISAYKGALSFDVTFDVKDYNAEVVWTVSNTEDLDLFSIDSLGDTQAGTYTNMHSGTFVAEEDATYGTVMKLANLDHSGVMARINFLNGTSFEEAKTIWTNKLANSSQIVFYVYNPATLNVTFRLMRSDWGVSKLDVTLTPNAWTVVSLTKEDFISCMKIDAWDADATAGYYFFMHADGNAALDNVAFRFTDFYGYTVEGYEKFVAENTEKAKAVINLINALPAIDTLNGRTAEIDAKLAEIDTVCSLLTDLASVTNYATYTEFVAAYNQLPALIWDASNASDLAMFSLESRNTATDDTYSKYAGGTISTSTDATYGTVMDINSLAWNVHFAKIDMMEGYHTIKNDGDNDISAGVLEWTNRLNGYDKVVFYVYNPADIDLELRFVDAAGFTSVEVSTRTLAAKQWTKIVYEKADFLNHIKFSSSTYLTIKNSGSWDNKSENLKGLSIKFTSFYGYTAEEYETAFPNA